MSGVTPHPGMVVLGAALVVARPAVAEPPRCGPEPWVAIAVEGPIDAVELVRDLQPRLRSVGLEACSAARGEGTPVERIEVRVEGDVARIELGRAGLSRQVPWSSEDSATSGVLVARAVTEAVRATAGRASEVRAGPPPIAAGPGLETATASAVTPSTASNPPAPATSAAPALAAASAASRRPVAGVHGLELELVGGVARYVEGFTEGRLGLRARYRRGAWGFGGGLAGSRAGATVPEVGTLEAWALTGRAEVNRALLVGSEWGALEGALAATLSRRFFSGTPQVGDAVRTEAWTAAVQVVLRGVVHLGRELSLVAEAQAGLPLREVVALDRDDNDVGGPQGVALGGGLGLRWRAF